MPAWAAGVPVRIHGEHGWDIQDPEGRRRRYRLLRRLYRPFVDDYIALSRHLSEYLEHQVGVAATSIAQIYNGVDTARFYPAAAARDSIAGCPFQAPDQWLIGSVGRLEGIKDPLNLARAFAIALRMQPSATNRLRLVVMGDGALRQQVEALLAESGVRELAWFAGERADVPQFMRGLDCFALPSLAEGVSNTILEAMATRLPIIATRVGGNAELIESGMTGTLVPSAHPEALARAILSYVTDRATARRHAKAAHHVAVDAIQPGRMVAASRAHERALAAAGVALPPSAAGLDAPLAPPNATAAAKRLSLLANLCAASVGIFDVSGKRTISRDLVARLNETQFHRGPDEQGLHFEPGLGLGHRRLSIIDLSTGNNRSPTRPQRRHRLQREIYNYRELIPELDAPPATYSGPRVTLS